MCCMNNYGFWIILSSMHLLHIIICGFWSHWPCLSFLKFYSDWSGHLHVVLCFTRKINASIIICMLLLQWRKEETTYKYVIVNEYNISMIHLSWICKLRLAIHIVINIITYFYAFILLYLVHVLRNSIFVFPIQLTQFPQHIHIQSIKQSVKQIWWWYLLYFSTLCSSFHGLSIWVFVVKKSYSRIRQRMKKKRLKLECDIYNQQITRRSIVLLKSKQRMKRWNQLNWRRKLPDVWLLCNNR